MIRVDTGSLLPYLRSTVFDLAMRIARVQINHVTNLCTACLLCLNGMDRMNGARKPKFERVNALSPQIKSYTEHRRLLCPGTCVSRYSFPIWHLRRQRICRQYDPDWFTQ